MPIAISERKIDGLQEGVGLSRQRLFAGEQWGSAGVTIDRISVASGSIHRIDVGSSGLIWLQMLSGRATLELPGSRADLADTHSITFPQDFKASLTTREDICFLQFEVRDTRGLDRGASSSPTTMFMVDWVREKVFEAKNDSRKRVPLVTARLCTAFRADMVVYPARSKSPTSHREGTGTFLYVIGGQGTANSGSHRYPLREGEFLYIADGESSSIETGPEAELRFIQLCVPGTFKTVWADPGRVSEWVETDRNIHGFKVGVVNPYATSRGGGMMF